MSAPSTSLATLRPDLGGSFSEYDLASHLNNLIAGRVLPPIEVMKPSGKFGKFTLAALLTGAETARASGGGYNRIANQFTDDSFLTEEHGIEDPVDDRDAAIYGEYFDAELEAALRARFVVLQNLEKRVASAVMNTTTWGSLKTAAAVVWTTKATATPVADIHGARESVYSQCGMWPNSIILSRTAFNRATETDEVIDRLKHSGQHNPGERVSEAAFAALCDLDQVIVGGVAKNTAAKGQAVSIAPVWSDSLAMVAKVAVTNSIKEACIGRIFHYSEDGSTIGGTAETYRDETVRADIARVRMDTDEKVLFPEAGHLLETLE